MFPRRTSWASSVDRPAEDKLINLIDELLEETEREKNYMSTTEPEEEKINFGDDAGEDDVYTAEDEPESETSPAPTQSPEGD